MRQNLALLLLSALAIPAKFAESAGAATTNKQIGACALLTKELLAKITPEDEQSFELHMRTPAAENPVGVAGSMCDYGGVLLQVDPFAVPAIIEEALGAEWTKISGLGDVAYFHDFIGEWGELYVRDSGRVITIQMDIPTGHTADSIRPNVIALAEAILPELR